MSKYDIGLILNSNNILDILFLKEKHRNPLPASPSRPSRPMNKGLGISRWF